MRDFVLLALAGCMSTPVTPAPSRTAIAYVSEPLWPGQPIVVQSAVPGLSGLTTDDEGNLWTVPEEERVLLQVDVSTGAARAFPIEGVPSEVELESVAFLSEGRFLIGTEAQEDRDVDALISVRLAGDRFEIEHHAFCPYAQWRVMPEANRGIEGLCHVGDEVIVATEVVREQYGRRYAPIARRTGLGWHSFAVELSSDTGKISGLTCMPAPDGGVDVVAIERHFGRTRVLFFRLPAVGLSEEEVVIQPQVLAHLDAWVATQSVPPNFEGISRLADGRFVMVIDNFHHREQSGPSKLFVLDGSVSFTQPPSTLARQTSGRTRTAHYSQNGVGTQGERTRLLSRR